MSTVGDEHWRGEPTLASLDLLIELINFSFYIIKIQLETPDIAKRGNRHWRGRGVNTEGGSIQQLVMIYSLNWSTFLFTVLKSGLKTWNSQKGEPTLRGVHTLKGGPNLKTLLDTNIRYMYKLFVKISRPQLYLKCHFEAVEVRSFWVKIQRI